MKVASSILLFCFLLPQPVLAEFRCSAEVKYRWKKTEGPERASFWATVERRAADEKKAKELTRAFADRERSRAAEACIRQHQNQSGCISSKLASFQETIQALPFTARAKIEESVIADCELAVGSCTGVDVSEPKCENLTPPPPTEEGEGEEEDKKGKKKKR
jgi:hypothetical protein